AVTGPKQDLARCAIAAEVGGKVWVAYSAHRGDAFHLFARSLIPAKNQPGEISLGAERQVTTGTGPNLTPVLATDAKGRVALAFQAWNSEGVARVGLMHLTTAVAGEKNGRLSYFGEST